jgi:hypothetical protein
MPALHRNPYDSHTLGPVIADLEKLTGAAMRRIHGDKRYRGHNYPNRFKVWIRGQVRRVTKAIRRNCVVAPPSSRDWPSQDHHRMRRYYLKGRDGDLSCSLPPASTSACLNCYCVSRYGSSVAASRRCVTHRARPETVFPDDFAESRGIFPTAILLAVIYIGG